MLCDIFHFKIWRGWQDRLQCTKTLESYWICNNVFKQSLSFDTSSSLLLLSYLCYKNQRKWLHVVTISWSTYGWGWLDKKRSMESPDMEVEKGDVEGNMVVCTVHHTPKGSLDSPTIQVGWGARMDDTQSAVETSQQDGVLEATASQETEWLLLCWQTYI